jgi:protein gp37
MRAYFKASSGSNHCLEVEGIGTGKVRSASWIDPLPNVWLGVSVEDQKTADERIPLLLQTPAAVRWISAEPLLGPVDLRTIQHDRMVEIDALTGDHGVYRPLAGRSDRHLDWVVVGGESGSGARPMEEAWARSLRDQCVAAGVAFHFKQWGAHLPAGCDGAEYKGQQILNASNAPVRIGKHAAGRLLDGRTWDEYPEVRQ